MSKPKKEEKKSEAKVEAPQAVAEVFSTTRDVEVLHPYHLDGDLEMYSEEKLKAREELRNDVDVVRELTEVRVRLSRSRSYTSGLSCKEWARSSAQSSTKISKEP